MVVSSLTKTAALTPEMQNLTPQHDGAAGKHFPTLNRGAGGASPNSKIFGVSRPMWAGPKCYDIYSLYSNPLLVVFFSKNTVIYRMGGGPEHADARACGADG